MIVALNRGFRCVVKTVETLGRSPHIRLHFGAESYPYMKLPLRKLIDAEIFA